MHKLKKLNGCYSDYSIFESSIYGQTMFKIELVAGLPGPIGSFICTMKIIAAAHHDNMVKG